VRKKAKRFIDDFFANQTGPYHSDKTGVALPDPFVQSREARKKEKQKKRHDTEKDKRHKMHHKKHHQHHHQHRSHHVGGQDGGSGANARGASPEPEAPPMSPVDGGNNGEGDAPAAVSSLAPVALPFGFVPTTITTEPTAESSL
jgi:hypothetical protein